MNFYLINSHPDRNKTTVASFKKACEVKNIVFNEIIPQEYTFYPTYKLSPGALVYRCAGSVKWLEQHIITPESVTLYNSYKRAISRYPTASYIIHEQEGLPIPKTFPVQYDYSRDAVKRYMDEIGEFPVIVKVIGGSHGVGVIKVDTLDSLFSVLDFATATGRDEVLLRQFIPAQSHARLIVLGEEVVGSIEYTSTGDDFRTNIDDPIVHAKEYSDDIKNTAIKAVSSLDLELGGVDIIIDEKTGNHFILEMNFPCFFPRVEMATGESISEKIIDFLIAKSNAK